jgi:hypothetical protein
VILAIPLIFRLDARLVNASDNNHGPLFLNIGRRDSQLSVRLGWNITLG